MVVVLSDAQPDAAHSINVQETQAITEAARLFGCRVFTIPLSSDVERVEGALGYASFEPAVAGVWTGYIPTVERYVTVYTAALNRGIRLLNTPAQYQTAMEFDRFYPVLADLTAESIVVRSVAECAGTGERLGYPVFVKGAVKSNKDQGWDSCVAADETQLERLVEDLLARPARSRGRAIVRKLIPLRHRETMPGGFPLSREYRVFLYGQDILAYSYYWDEYPDAWKVTSAEEAQIVGLAREAAKRLAVPFLAVDIAQLETGRWIIIEVADAQFAGLSQVPVLELWSKIKDIDLL